MKIDFVNKRFQRLIRFDPAPGDVANCYVCMNVRDESTCTLVATNVPEKVAWDWCGGAAELPEECLTPEGRAL